MFVEPSYPRARKDRQHRAVDAYLDQADAVGGDRDKDREAKALAMDRAGFVRFSTTEAKVKHFNRIWRGDDARAYICERWGFENPEHPDPVSFITTHLREHVEQRDERWGKPDRVTSLAALAQMSKIFVPAQTMKVDTRSVIAKIERPPEFDVEPKMESRAILPAGQTIAKPKPPEPDEDDEDDDDDDDEE